MSFSITVEDRQPTASPSSVCDAPPAGALCDSCLVQEPGRALCDSCIQTTAPTGALCDSCVLTGPARALCDSCVPGAPAGAPAAAAPLSPLDD
jgi:hypothetical protein